MLSNNHLFYTSTKGRIMQKSIIPLSIFLFFTSAFYGMEERVADDNQKKEERQRDRREILQGLSDDDRKLYEKLHQYDAKQAFEDQRAQVEISERKNKEFHRFLSVTAYWVGGIAIVGLGIILYDTWKKAGAEKHETLTNNQKITT